MNSRATWLVCALWAIGAIGVARCATPYSNASVGAHEVSREQATQEVQKRYGSAARVVRSDVIDQNGNRLYVFRLLSANGKVWIVRIDARSGVEVP